MKNMMNKLQVKRGSACKGIEQGRAVEREGGTSKQGKTSYQLPTSVETSEKENESGKRREVKVDNPRQVDSGICTVSLARPRQVGSLRTLCDRSKATWQAWGATVDGLRPPV